MVLPVATVLMALMVLPAAADDQINTYDLTGRWTSGHYKYAVDIAKCGDEWCGVRLKNDQSCGAVVLRLTPMTTPNSPAMLTGTLDLQPEVENYKVSVTFDRASDGKPSSLHMLGDPDVAPSFMTRTIKFYDLLARSGEAVCKAEPKTS